MNREQILSTAIQYITKDRAALHGAAEDTFANIGELWGWWMHGKQAYTFSDFDVAIMMTLFKIARIKGNPDHIDSYIDGAGYLALAGEIQCMEK